MNPSFMSWKYRFHPLFLCVGRFCEAFTCKPPPEALSERSYDVSGSLVKGVSASVMSSPNSKLMTNNSVR